MPSKICLLYTSAFSTEFPVGSFNLFDIAPPCGIADADGNLIGAEALPDIFYNYKRIKGEIIWFTEGYLEYHVSNATIKNKVLEALQKMCIRDRVYILRPRESVSFSASMP